MIDLKVLLIYVSVLSLTFVVTGLISYLVLDGIAKVAEMRRGDKEHGGSSK